VYHHLYAIVFIVCTFFFFFSFSKSEKESTAKKKKKKKKKRKTHSQNPRKGSKKGELMLQSHITITKRGGR